MQTTPIALASRITSTIHAKMSYPLMTTAILGSFHFREVGRFPVSVESCCFGPVNAEVHEPSFAGDRLDPPARMFGRSVRAKNQIDRLALGVLEFEERAERGVPLIRRDFGTRLHVVDRDRPEQLGRDGLRHRELVGLAAVEISTGRVTRPKPVE